MSFSDSIVAGLAHRWTSDHTVLRLPYTPSLEQPRVIASIVIRLAAAGFQCAASLGNMNVQVSIMQVTHTSRSCGLRTITTDGLLPLNRAKRVHHLLRSLRISFYVHSDGMRACA